METLGKFLAIILAICNTFFLTMYAGFVLSQTWLWFVVPLGVPAINKWHALGLVLVAGWPLIPVITKLDAIKEPWWKNLESDEVVAGIYDRMLISAIITSMLWGLAYGYHWLSLNW